MSEVRSVSSLALLYVFRMLGLFMVLPVLMLYGTQYEGATPFYLGVALGIYGLTQALFQIPLGMLSDKLGRKPVIALGLFVFAVGSVIAAYATTVEGLIIGRALQGSGAIAGALMATVADLTSERNRTKAMAMIGVSIGVAFSLAMILGPALAAAAGLAGVFGLSAILALVGIAIVFLLLPTPQKKLEQGKGVVISAMFWPVLSNHRLVRLNLGIFFLHCILMMSFVAVPMLLDSALALSREAHWKFYLPVMLLAFIGMLPLMFFAEKKQQAKPVFMIGIALLGLGCGLLTIVGDSFIMVLLAVFLFFVAFNLLESMLPSLVSKVAPTELRGTAMGVYATSQFLGAFMGGFLGGWIVEAFTFAYVLGGAAALTIVWFVLVLPMQFPQRSFPQTVSSESALTDSKSTAMNG